MFTMINALIFLNFDDDSLTNRNLFIELRDNVFFMFFEFMISTFAHEFLSREFVMLLFFAIRINVENDSKNVFDFKFATIFFFRDDHFSFMKKRFRFYEFCDNEFENFANRLRFFCEIQSHFDATRQISLFFFFFFTLQFEIHAMCLRFSHTSHFLCLSMMLRSQSLVRCFFAHVSYTTTFLQCLSI
jgi:hypothetical protein